MSLLNVVLLCVAAAAGSFYVARYLFRADERVEDRRRAAAQLAGILRKYGLEKTPVFLESYAVGDYSQMGQDIVDLVKLFLAGEKAVVAELEQVFNRVLTVKLQTEEGRAYVASLLGEAIEKATAT